MTIKKINELTKNWVLFCMITVFVILNAHQSKAVTVVPSEATINVIGIPSGVSKISVEVFIDKSMIALAPPKVDVGFGFLDPIGIRAFILDGDGNLINLPSTLKFTLPFFGLTEGNTSLSVGNVFDSSNNTLIPIQGAMASASVNSINVIEATPESLGGLSNDTFKVNLSGSVLDTTTALNIYLSNSNPNVASLTTGILFNGGSAELTLADTNISKNILTIVWNGSAGGAVTLTGKLKPGISNGGSTTISVIKVEAAGGIDITNQVSSSVTPSTTTKQSTSSSTTVPEVGTNNNQPVNGSPNNNSGTLPSNNQPSINIDGQSSLALNSSLKQAKIRLLVSGNDITSKIACVASQVSGPKVKISPRRIILSPSITSKNVIVLIPRKGILDVLASGVSQKLLIKASCTNGATSEKEILLNP